MSSSSEQNAKHTCSSSHSLLNKNSHLISSSCSNSHCNGGEEETNKNDSNSTSENSGDEGLLTQIDSMPSLDSEILMSPNNIFPNFSKNSTAGSDTDNENIDDNSDENSDENGPTKFPSIMPDELPMLDTSLIISNNHNIEVLSSSNSDSNAITRDVQIDSQNKDENGKSKLRKIEISSKKGINSHILQTNNKSKKKQINSKRKILNFSKDVYTYDFENDDDDGDPSFNLPMPMLMPALPESPSKRSQALPLKRDSITNDHKKTLEKTSSDIKSRFLGFKGYDEYEATLLKKCHICSKNIEEEGSFINGWYYHKKCLACSKCGKSLSKKQKCYMYHEQLMCDKCVHINLNEVSVCCACGQKIYYEDEKIDLKNGQKVHSSCLSCYICGQSLALKDAQIVDDDISTIEHSNSTKISANKSIDNDDYSSFSSNKKRKKVCNDRRTSNFSCDTLVPSEDGVKMTKFVCKHCHSFLMKEQVCYTCGNPILENIVIKNQRAFHRQCFRCEDIRCNQQLFGNSYVIHHNKFLCWEHGKIYSSSCAYCKQLFKSYETDRIKWHLKLYHKACFVCRVCGYSVDPQTCKSIHGRPHCDKCFQIRVDEGDCDERGRSFYVHYDQMHQKKVKRKSKNESYSEDDNSKSHAGEEEENNSDNTDSSFNFDMKENLKKKHETHSHVAKQALLRKSRFHKKYNVDIYWPEYCEKVFEKAKPYKPEEDKNVFKKF